MKIGNMLVSVFAVLAAVQVGSAEGIHVDFDGRSSKSMSVSAAMINTSMVGNNSFAVSEAVSVPVDKTVSDSVDKNVKIDVTMKQGEAEIKETLLCKSERAGTRLEECRKDGGFFALTREDVDGFVLGSYFTANKSGFDDLLSVNKHSYTNTSGTMTFHCVDMCKSWKPVSSTNGCSAGTSGVGCNTSVTSECVEWSHSCSCIKGC